MALQGGGGHLGRGVLGSATATRTIRSRTVLSQEYLGIRRICRELYRDLGPVHRRDRQMPGFEEQSLARPVLGAFASGDEDGSGALLNIRNVPNARRVDRIFPG